MGKRKTGGSFYRSVFLGGEVLNELEALKKCKDTWFLLTDEVCELWKRYLEVTNSCYCVTESMLFKTNKTHTNNTQSHNLFM